MNVPVSGLPGFGGDVGVGGADGVAPEGVPAVGLGDALGVVGTAVGAVVETVGGGVVVSVAWGASELHAVVSRAAEVRVANKMDARNMCFIVPGRVGCAVTGRSFRR